MAEYDLRTGLMDGRQPELRNWDNRSIKAGAPGLMGDFANYLYSWVPGGGEMSPETQRRVMDVSHGLTNALMQSPVGMFAVAHDVGAKAADHASHGEWAKAAGTALGGGVALMTPFALGRAFGPGNRDVNIAKTLEAFAPGESALGPVSAYLSSLRAKESQLLRDNSRLQGLLDNYVPGRDFGAANVNNRADMRPRLMPVND